MTRPNQFRDVSGTVFRASVSCGVLVVACLFVGYSIGVADPPDAGSPDAGSPDAGSKEESTERIDPLSVNATCYVCHMTFVREPISRVHFKNKVTCIDCHGLSAGHANDEDIGATKPDTVYRRDQIDAICGKCHEEHDVPAVDVLARYRDREITAMPPVCTDCHGMHKIEPPEP